MGGVLLSGIASVTPLTVTRNRLNVIIVTPHLGWIKRVSADPNRTWPLSPPALHFGEDWPTKTSAYRIGDASPRASPFAYLDMKTEAAHCLSRCC